MDGCVKKIWDSNEKYHGITCATLGAYSREDCDDEDALDIFEKSFNVVKKIYLKIG